MQKYSIIINNTSSNTSISSKKPQMASNVFDSVFCGRHQKIQNKCSK